MVHYILATIAPGASFYGAGYNCSSAYSDFYEAVEWLVGKGVNIINMSASAYTSTANVTSYSGCTRWIEHIAYNHDTHFVKSSGDRGSIGVTEPGMAYNIITVGGIEYELDYQRWENSSYYNGLIDRTENKTGKNKRPRHLPDDAAALLICSQRSLPSSARTSSSCFCRSCI